MSSRGTHLWNKLTAKKTEFLNSEMVSKETIKDSLVLIEIEINSLLCLKMY